MAVRLQAVRKAMKKSTMFQLCEGDAIQPWGLVKTAYQDDKGCTRAYQKGIGKDAQRLNQAQPPLPGASSGWRDTLKLLEITVESTGRSKA